MACGILNHPEKLLCFSVGLTQHNKITFGKDARCKGSEPILSHKLKLWHTVTCKRVFEDLPAMPNLLKLS